MNILSCTGSDDLATVTVARFGDDPANVVEFVDARDPDLPRSEKWVVIISTQFGCPIGCAMCDSGASFHGNLTAAQMFAQVDHVVRRRQDHRAIVAKKFKVQFARMGEPALNENVLHVLRELPSSYDAPGLVPCIATTMPTGSEAWFDQLREIRHTLYDDHVFQLQASINTTDRALRDRLMPYPKQSFEEIARYGAAFVRPGDRKIGLNFAWTDDYPIDPRVVARHFDPDHFCIKVTPLNPTYAVAEENLRSAFSPQAPAQAESLCEEFERLGFETILSIGDTRENDIGSNCGMSVRALRERRDSYRPS